MEQSTPWNITYPYTGYLQIRLKSLVFSQTMIFTTILTASDATDSAFWCCHCMLYKCLYYYYYYYYYYASYCSSASIQGGHTALKVLGSPWNFFSIFPGPGKSLKMEYSLESFGIWCKRYLKVLEFQYFRIVITTLWRFCSHYIAPQCSTLQLHFTYLIGGLFKYC